MLPPGVTIEDANRYLDSARVSGPGLDAELLELLLESVVEVAAERTGRRFYPTPATPEGAADDAALPVNETVICDGSRWIRVPDAREITRVVADGVELDLTTLRMARHKIGGTIVRIRAGSPIQTAVITGRFGFATVPAALRDAIYTHAARNFQERQALYGDAAELGDGSGVVNFFRRIPPRVAMIYDDAQVTTAIRLA